MFVLFGLLFLPTLFLILKSTCKYKITGLIVVLEVGLLLAEASIIIEGALNLRAINIILAEGPSFQQHDQAVQLHNISTVFLCLSPAITEVVHWLFAIKYWSLAVKIELIT